MDYNYQNPMDEREEFIIDFVGKNFLIIVDSFGNKIRLKYHSTSLYSKEEKIYKQQGEFLLWK